MQQGADGQVPGLVAENLTKKGKDVMLGFGIEAQGDRVIYGNRNDTCVVCVDDLVRESRLDNDMKPLNHIQAREKLRGSVFNKPVFKIPAGVTSNGERSLVCQKCLNKIIGEIEAEAERQPKAESAEKE